MSLKTYNFSHNLVNTSQSIVNFVKGWIRPHWHQDKYAVFYKIFWKTSLITVRETEGESQHRAKNKQQNITITPEADQKLHSSYRSIQ